MQNQIGGVAQEDNSNLLSKQTNKTTSSHSFKNIFKKPQENPIENISQNQDIQKLEKDIQNTISKANSIIQKNKLTVDTPNKSHKDHTEMDSLISQLEEVANDD